MKRKDIEKIFELWGGPDLGPLKSEGITAEGFTTYRDGNLLEQMPADVLKKYENKYPCHCGLPCKLRWSYRRQYSYFRCEKPGEQGCGYFRRFTDICEDPLEADDVEHVYG